jgi:hypothetical protein
MKNSNEREGNTDGLPLEYFHRWDKRDKKSEKIYIRVRPEDKKTILSACTAAGLSISDMVMGSALEASEAIIKSYHAKFPNSKLQ